MDATGNTHLHLAAYRSEVGRVHQLLQLNPRANVNLRNKEGETPLYECLEGNRTKTAKEKILLLLQHGADPNIPDNAGKTPLQLAVEKNRIEEANLLRQWGARE